MVQTRKRGTNGEAPPETALELTTFTGPGDVVTIDGERYELLNFGSLGLRDRAELNALAERIQKIERKANPTPADVTEHRRKLLELGARVLPGAPAEKLAALTDQGLEDLGVTFFVRGAMRSPRVAMLKRSRIGGTSFPDSPSATASARESS